MRARSSVTPLFVVVHGRELASEEGTRAVHTGSSGCQCRVVLGVCEVCSH